LGAGSGHETHPVRVASLIIMRNLLVSPLSFCVVESPVSTLTFVCCRVIT